MSTPPTAMLNESKIAEIRKRCSYRDDFDALLADREELERRLAEAEAELEGLREIATSPNRISPMTPSLLSPRSWRKPLPVTKVPADLLEAVRIAARDMASWHEEADMVPDECEQARATLARYGLIEAAPVEP